MSTALITLATGTVYQDYANAMIASARQFWPEAHAIVFTDRIYGIRNAWKTINTEPKGHPGETLYRYHTFLKAEDVLRQYDHVFYCDADMQWVSPAGDEMIGAGLMATLHPGYYGKSGTYETRMESTAYTPPGSAYYCGGFQGGATNAYIAAMKDMREKIDIDAKNGITAVWHDESHWNRYLRFRKDFITLSPSYCYPEDYRGQWGWAPDKFKPILVALNKAKRGNHWSQR